MKPLKYSAPDPVAHHREIKPRIYADDELQAPRILKAREFVSETVGNIIELGCGTADIGGPFSHERIVEGYDCSGMAIEEARRRFPKGKFYVAEIEKLEPRTCDVLVLCECLEHLVDPIAVVKNWLPLAKYAVISHPIDEPEESTLAAGEHRWSLSGRDMELWFEMGGMQLERKEEMVMGCYTVGFARGRRD